MGFLEAVALYPITVMCFLIIDLFWLGIIAKKLYLKEMGAIVRSKTGYSINPRKIPAMIFYFLFNIGILVFPVNQAVEEDSTLYAVVLGGLYGLFTYGTYELTNFAVMKEWSLKITVVDLIWGVVLSSLVSTSSFLAYSLIF